MYSPASSRRNLFGSASSSKNSPARRPTLSPSAEGIPFSFSTENLNSFIREAEFDGNSAATGFPPLRGSEARSGIASSSSVGDLSSRVNFAGKSLSLGSTTPGQSGAGASSGGTGSGAFTPGGTVKHFQEGMRELKKENFNLKLRIYFLEDRLGNVTRPSPPGTAAETRRENEDLRKINTDLKIQTESLKYDVQEKTELLREAAAALEQLEGKLSAMTIEREEERKRLFDGLQQQLEVDDEDERRMAKRGPSSSGSEGTGEDDKLIREVEAEMARPPLVSASTTPANKNTPSLLLPLNLSSAPVEPLVIRSTASAVLSAVQERQEAEVMAGRVEELERNAEEMNKSFGEMKTAKQEAEREVQQQLKDMIALESELVNRDIKLASVEGELSQLRAEIADFNAAKDEEVEKINKQKFAVESKLEKSEGENAALRMKLEENGEKIRELEENREALLIKLKTAPKLFTSTPIKKVKETCPEADRETSFSIHTHQLKEENGDKLSNLEIVTQTLSIPPENAVSDADKMKKDMSKLKEYLKRSVQERKLLLKKIGALNTKIYERSLSCDFDDDDLLNGGENNSSILQQAKILLLRIANANQTLARSCEKTSQVRAYLETLADAFDSLLTKCKAPAGISRHLVESIRTLVGECGLDSRPPTPLILESIEERGDIIDNDEDRASCASSNWLNGSVSLPDPTNLLEEDLRSAAEMSLNRNDYLVRKLNEELEKRNKDIEGKMRVLDLMEEQIEEKDRVIIEQERLLDDYRNELIDIRGEGGAVLKINNPLEPQTDNSARSKHRRRFPSHIRGVSGVGGVGVISDGEDSWSEPDINAARKRMGLAAQFLHPKAPMAEKDCCSSETDADRQKSFYALEYTTSEGGGKKAESPDEFDDEGDVDAVIFDDYSKIIEELQSHRREIEKLQTDFASSNTLCQKDDEVDEDDFLGPRTVKVDVCNSRKPGSLECLNESISQLFGAMNDLTYQLELSDSIDSGVATEEDDYDTEAETPAAEEANRIQFYTCTGCAKIVCDEFEPCLQKCGELVVSATRAIRRLRRLCCGSGKRLAKAGEEIAGKNHLISSLESDLERLRIESDERALKLKGQIDVARDDLSRKSRELQDALVKMNDNYKLVAELSNENLKLTGDKVRVEEVLDAMRKDQKRLREELDSARGVIAAMDNRAYPASDVEHHQKKHHHHHHHHRNNRRFRGGGGGHKKASHKSYDSADAFEQPRLPAPPVSSSVFEAVSGATPKVVGANDISSPDLGVDVSSDPFSSLERQSHFGDPGQQGNQPKIASMVVENHQLRQERDLLLQKLIRSKGALKDTLDRLATSSAATPTTSTSSSSQVSSSSLLQSVGKSPSRAKVTQDLVEFSRTHRQRSHQHHHHAQKQQQGGNNSQQGGNRRSKGPNSNPK